MSVKLTMVKTKEEQWTQEIGLKNTCLRLEFSGEHKITANGGTTIVEVSKQSELYEAFYQNLDDVFKMGVEKALQKVLKELVQLKLDKKQYSSLKKSITKELEPDNVFIES